MLNWFKSSPAEEVCLQAISVRGDLIMTCVSWFLWLASLCFAAFFYGEWNSFLLIATPLSLVCSVLCWRWPGVLLTRTSIAVILMLYSGLLIHLAHGAIEAHFSIFALLAFLLYYRDWHPVAAATITIALHHFVACRLQMLGLPVFVFPAGHPCTMVWVHAAYVILEAAVLCYLGGAIRKEALETAAIATFGRRLIETGMIDLRGSASGLASSPALESLLGALTKAVGKAGDVAGGMSDVSGEVTHAARQILAAGTEQQNCSQSAVRLVQNMAEAAEHVARTCGEVSSVALGSVTLVEQGSQTIRSTALTIESLVGTVVKVSSEMGRLHVESQRIEEIIAIISDIAEQTNLLALNASIEAARAGDAGRTFHVVAREIRDLSLRTHSSLALAQQRVDCVRERAASVSELTTVCAREAQLGGSKVEQTSASLEQVIQQLPRIARQAREVVEMSQQYSSLGVEALTEMRDVERMIATNSANLNRIDLLGQSLQLMSGDLIGSVRVFQMHRA